MQNKPQNKGIMRIVHAFFYSMHGLRACFRTEEAFRQEAFLAAVFFVLAWFVGETPVEIALLISVIALVLIVELLNTGIERAIDRISFERHELSKEAKDMGSAAVFISLLLFALVWLLIAWPKFF